MTEALFSHIDAQADDFVTRVMDYVRHPSISAHDIGIREVLLLYTSDAADDSLRVDPGGRRPM